MAEGWTAEEFRVIYLEHVQGVVGFLRRSVDRDVAQDLAARTFMIGWQKRDDFDSARGTVRNWLWGIANNVLLHHHRSVGRERRAVARLSRYVDADRGVDLQEEVVSGIDMAERGSAIQAAIATMRPADQTIIRMWAVESCTYEEIAEAFDVPIGTVRSRLSRLRSKLGRETASQTAKDDGEEVEG